MRKAYKSYRPRNRRPSQQFDGRETRTSVRNDNFDFESELAPRHISYYVKSFLVQLGVRRIIPQRLCAKLINTLGLRSA